MMLGKFITIEGGEGVGKSTQIAAAREVIERARLEVVLTREPGGTERGERIRDRGEVLGDRFEREQTDFFDRVRNTYLTIGANESARVKVIDAARDIESVKRDVQNIVGAFMNTHLIAKQ